MPLTNAERQRMYRMRRDNDPAKRAEYLLKKSSKYKDDIVKRIRKRVSQMTDRELRKQRSEWRKRQRNCRRKKNVADEEEDENFVSSTISSVASATSSRGWRRVQRNKSALYRENMRLQTELLKYKRTAEKYKKRCSRMRQSQSEVGINDTPRRSTEALLRSGNKDKIRKTLRFHKVLMAQITAKYKSARTPRQKQHVASAVTGHIIKKYRQMNLLTSQVGMTNKIHKAVLCGKPSFSSPVFRKTYRDIRCFYER